MSDDDASVVDVSDSVSAPVTNKSSTVDKKAASNAMKATKTKPATSGGKSPAGHPPYSDMVVATIRSLSSPTGVSRQAIIKKIKEDYKLGDNSTRISNWINITLKKGLESGLLKKAAAEGRKGAGSYKLGDQAKSSVSLSKSRSSAKLVAAESLKIKKLKIKKVTKVTTPSKTLKSKTVSKAVKSKVAKKNETSKSGKSKTKPKKTADAAVKKQTASSKKPDTVAKKSTTTVKKSASVVKKPATTAKKPATDANKSVTSVKKPATTATKPAKSASAVKKTTSAVKKSGSAVKKSGRS